MKAEHITKSPAETIQLGKKLASRLNGGDIVLFYGELGSGKTHFIKGIAEGLGISMTIKSPTYAYVNRFKIEDSRLKINDLSHYGLYRFGEGAVLSSIGYDETLEDPGAINVVEWADRLGDNVPRRYIKVDFETINGSRTEPGASGYGENKRKIHIEFIGPSIPNEQVIHQLYDDWATPKHVRAHIKQVANVAIQMAEAYVKRGEIINLNLLYAASMLHDISRVCDFKTLERDNFKEDVTDEKWKKWESCRLEYKGIHHADIAHEQLAKLGFPEVAELVRLHRSLNIIDEPESYDTLEKKILYYADKRAKHDEIVDLKERFRDGKERYGGFDGMEERKLFEEVEEKTYQLEKELFGGLGIGAEDIC